MTVAFIVGCPRSGTSILGQVVGTHPDIEYLSELLNWGTSAFGGHRLDAIYATPLITARLRHEVEKIRQGKLVVLEKNPRHSLQIPFLRAIWPDCRIVHIVRDGRDVTCSLMPGIGGEAWSHLKPPCWRILQTSYQGLERCAHFWHIVMGYLVAELEEGSFMQIRYEDLLEHPEAVIGQVLDYVSLPWTDEISLACEQITDRIDPTIPGLTTWCRNDHTKRIGRWHENMTEADIERVMPILAPMLERLGYA